MTESTRVDPRESESSHYLTIKPNEGEDTVNLYTADWGLIGYAQSAGKVNSTVLAATEQGGLKIKRVKGRTVYSSYVRIKEAPDQPDLVGKTAWVWREEYKDKKGETVKKWINIGLGE